MVHSIITAWRAASDGSGHSPGDLPSLAAVGSASRAKQDIYRLITADLSRVAIPTRDERRELATKCERTDNQRLKQHLFLSWHMHYL